MHEAGGIFYFIPILKPVVDIEERQYTVLWCFAAFKQNGNCIIQQ